MGKYLQIYRLLRKSRVITNISSNSLFALPNNQAYVYVLEEEQEDEIPDLLVQDTLRRFCTSKGTFQFIFLYKLNYSWK